MLGNFSEMALRITFLCLIAGFHAYGDGVLSPCRRVSFANQGVNVVWEYIVKSPSTVSIVGASHLTANKDGDVVLRIPESLDGRYVFDIAPFAFSNNQQIVEVEISGKWMRLIGKCAFVDCKNLRSLRIGSDCIHLRIGESAFYGCTSLRETRFLGIIASVGRYAFRKCSALESVHFAYAHDIWPHAFSECSQLRAVNIPEDCDCSFGSAFALCPSLERIELSLRNPNYMKKGAILYTRDERFLCLAPARCSGGAIDVPEKTQSICDYAFAYADVTEIMLPDGLENIGRGAFMLCTGLREVHIPKTVEEIQDYAFIGCSNLNSVVFQGGKLPKIGQSVFMKDVRLVCDEKEFADVSKHVFFCPSRTK